MKFHILLDKTGQLHIKVMAPVGELKAGSIHPLASFIDKYIELLPNEKSSPRTTNIQPQLTDQEKERFINIMGCYNFEEIDNFMTAFLIVAKKSNIAISSQQFDTIVLRATGTDFIKEFRKLRPTNGFFIRRSNVENSIMMQILKGYLIITKNDLAECGEKFLGKQIKIIDEQISKIKNATINHHHMSMHDIANLIKDTQNILTKMKDFLRNPKDYIWIEVNKSDYILSVLKDELLMLHAESELLEVMLDILLNELKNSLISSVGTIQNALRSHQAKTLLNARVSHQSTEEAELADNISTASAAIANLNIEIQSLDETKFTFFRKRDDATAALSDLSIKLETLQHIRAELKTVIKNTNDQISTYGRSLSSKLAEINRQFVTASEALNQKLIKIEEIMTHQKTALESEQQSTLDLSDNLRKGEERYLDLYGGI